MESAGMRPGSVASAGGAVRVDFFRRTYTHLALAILCFVLVESLLLGSAIAPVLVQTMVGWCGWFLVLGAFMGVSWLADRWARSDASPQMQYMGLGLYIVAQAVVFLPILYIATHYSSPEVIPTAGVMTLLLFGGLTFTAFTTRADFSFLRGILTIGSFIALGIILCSMLFGFSLGLFFSSIMVIFAACSVLYTTSNIIHHYRADQHVAASLALFAGVALMFWYLLQILMSLGGGDD